MPAVTDQEKSTYASTDGEEERYFKNPTYEGNSTKTGITPDPVTYDAIDVDGSQKAEDANTYDVPDKHWQADQTHIV